MWAQFELWETGERERRNFPLCCLQWSLFTKCSLTEAIFPFLMLSSFFCHFCLFYKKKIAFFEFIFWNFLFKPRQNIGITIWNKIYKKFFKFIIQNSIHFYYKLCLYTSREHIFFCYLCLTLGPNISNILEHLCWNCDLSMKSIVFRLFWHQIHYASNMFHYENFKFYVKFIRFSWFFYMKIVMFRWF